MILTRLLEFVESILIGRVQTVTHRMPDASYNNYQSTKKKIMNEIQRVVIVIKSIYTCDGFTEHISMYDSF